MKNKEAMDYFKEILIKDVYLRTIEDWEKILDGRMKSPLTTKTQENLATLNSEQFDALRDAISEIVKTSIHFFLWNIDDSYLDLIVSNQLNQSETPVSLKKISSGLAGDFWGWIDELDGKSD